MPSTCTVHERYGWELAGAWETIMVDEAECFVLWAIPSWESWVEYEKEVKRDPALVGWRTMARDVASSTSRILLIDSPFCPFKLGRQPQRADRTEPWDEG